jgi:hypothetical protein
MASGVIRLGTGNVSDNPVADDLVEAADPVRHLIADRGYDANRLRHPSGNATIPIIPGATLTQISDPAG